MPGSDYILKKMKLDRFSHFCPLEKFDVMLKQISAHPFGIPFILTYCIYLRE